MNMNFDAYWDSIFTSEARIKEKAVEFPRRDLAPGKSSFFKQLRREEGRTHRTKAPLSIALIWLSNKQPSQCSNCEGVLKLIQNSMRETDSLGRISENIVGVILPDTDQDRTQDFIKRVVDRHKGSPFSIIAGTYPDRLFHDLLNENEHSYAKDLIEGNFKESNRTERGYSFYIEESVQAYVVPRLYFLEQLRCEKRRADRSKSQLSIAVICFNNKNLGQDSSFKGVLQLVQRCIRGTDTLGYLGEEVIGIVLPDTDEHRAQEVKRRIANGHEGPSLSIVTGTYPNQLFHAVLTENYEQEGCFPLLIDDTREDSRFGSFIKRGVDIVGSLFGIVFFSPLMLIVALAIKLSSSGPVIFKQTRLGRSGISFDFYKFRSMFSDTDNRIHRDYVTQLIEGNHEEVNQGDEEKPLYKIKSDPRVTAVGRIIRKTSIDELPQLLNVLKGEMSLVGPRPPLPYEVDKYQSWHLRRILEMKPGITGLWQVGGRSETSFDDMVRLDIRYIQDWSLLLDAKILLKTVKVVLRSTGAF